MVQTKDKKATSNIVAVEIMGKEYKVMCAEDKIESLKKAAVLLNKKINDIRHSTGKVQGAERVTVMAALNIAHELMNVTAGDVDLQAINRMHTKLDTAIGRNSELGL